MQRGCMLTDLLAWHLSVWMFGLVVLSFEYENCFPEPSTSLSPVQPGQLGKYSDRTSYWYPYLHVPYLGQNHMCHRRRVSFVGIQLPTARVAKAMALLEVLRLCVLASIAWAVDPEAHKNCRW